MATNTNAAVSAEMLVERARALRPTVLAYRDQMESERRQPEPLTRALVNAGLFHLWVPRSIGGHETDPVTAIRVVEEISRGDGSAGWNLMNGASYGVFAGFVPEPVAKAIYSTPPFGIAAGQLPPKGRATAVPGGYRVSGRWSFGSGIHQCSWVLTGCTVYDGDTPRATSSGAPEVIFVFVPVAQCEVHDTWYTGGLRGTGSDDYSITDAFVPDDHTFTPSPGRGISPARCIRCR